MRKGKLLDNIQRRVKVRLFISKIWRVIDNRVTNEQIGISLFGTIRLSAYEKTQVFLTMNIHIFFFKSLYSSNRLSNGKIPFKKSQQNVKIKNPECIFSFFNNRFFDPKFIFFFSSFYIKLVREGNPPPPSHIILIRQKVLRE